MKRIMAALLLAFIMPALPAAGVTFVRTKAPDFSLQDQHDRQFTLQSFAGRPLALLASDKKGDEESHQWGAVIRKKYGNRVQITGIADVRTVPFFLKGMVKNDFKKDREVILLDWDGAVFNSYGLSKGVANVVLIDGHGMVRYQYAGSPSSQAIEVLFKALDDVLKAE